MFCSIPCSFVCELIIYDVTFVLFLLLGYIIKFMGLWFTHDLYSSLFEFLLIKAPVKVNDIKVLYIVDISIHRCTAIHKRVIQVLI